MTILKTGQLIKRTKDKRETENYVMRLISTGELKDVMELQKYVYDQLPNKQVLYLDTYEEILEDMEQGAKVVGVFNEAKDIIAYRHIGFPGMASKNLGNDIDLPEQELPKVAHLETTVVHPQYRGNSLQSLTLQQVVPMIKDFGYNHLFCTVSPQNIYSLYNIMKNGLRVRALKKKYGVDENGNDGVWRFILHKDLTPRPEERTSDLFSIPLIDIEPQLKLIEKGFIGLWLSRETKLLNYVRLMDSPAY